MKQYVTLYELHDLQEALQIHERLHDAGVYAFLEYANTAEGLVIKIRVRRVDADTATATANAA